MGLWVLKMKIDLLVDSQNWTIYLKDKLKDCEMMLWRDGKIWSSFSLSLFSSIYNLTCQLSKISIRVDSDVKFLDSFFIRFEIEIEIWEKKGWWSDLSFHPWSSLKKPQHTLATNHISHLKQDLSNYLLHMCESVEMRWVSFFFHLSI